MNTKYLFPFCLILALFGCKSPTESVQSQTPFTLQSSWIYSDQTFNADRTANTSTTDSIYVASLLNINGVTYYTLSDSSSIIDSNGYMTGYDQTNCACYVEKMPAIANDTILRRDGIPLKINGQVNMGSIILFASNTDTTITVPAGTFQCAEYHFQLIFNNSSIGEEDIIFVSPSIGMIQYDTYIRDPITNKIYLSKRRQLIRSEK